MISLSGFFRRRQKSVQKLSIVFQRPSTTRKIPCTHLTSVLNHFWKEKTPKFFEVTTVTGVHLDLCRPCGSGLKSQRMGLKKNATVFWSFELDPTAWKFTRMLRHQLRPGLQCVQSNLRNLKLVHRKLLINRQTGSDWQLF